MLRQTSTILSVRTSGRGFVEVTQALRDFVGGSGIREGLASLLVRHTSASIFIQENAAREVRADLAAWFERLAPEGPGYAHNDEGPDDMPAHLRAVLTGVTLAIPVRHGAPLLGTWQGIWLAEHRAQAHTREIAVHLIGE